MPAGGGYPLPVRTPNTPNSLSMLPTWSAQLQSSKNNLVNLYFTSCLSRLVGYCISQRLSLSLSSCLRPAPRSVIHHASPFVVPLFFSWLFHPFPRLHLSSTFTSHCASLVRLVVAFPSASASPSRRLCPTPRSTIHHTSPLCRAHLTRLVVMTRPPPLVAHLSFGWLLHDPAPQPIVWMAVVCRVITLLPSVGLHLLPLIRDSAQRRPPP